MYFNKSTPTPENYAEAVPQDSNGQSSSRTREGEFFKWVQVQYRSPVGSEWYIRHFFPPTEKSQPQQY